MNESEESLKQFLEDGSKESISAALEISILALEVSKDSGSICSLISEKALNRIIDIAEEEFLNEE